MILHPSMNNESQQRGLGGARSPASLLPLSIIFKYTRAIIGVNINNASVIKGLGLQSCRDFLLMVLSDYPGHMRCHTDWGRSAGLPQHPTQVAIYKSSFLFYIFRGETLDAACPVLLTPGY